MRPPKLTNHENQHLITIFKALGQQERLTLLLTIAEYGGDGITPSELRRYIDLSPSHVSFHLKTLIKANLVRANKRGRHIYYSLQYDYSDWFIKILAQHLFQTDKLKITITRPAYSKDDTVS